MENTTDTSGVRNAGPDRAPAELLDVQAVAKLLDCSPRHVYRLADAGRMPKPLKVGALVRWRRVDVTQWVADGCPPVRTTKRGAR